MKKSFFVLIALGVISSSASFAADPTDGKSPALAVGKIMCDKLYVAHTPSADVAYQAGVDVNGQPVAPADVAPPVVTTPDYMEVPMTYDLAKSMNLSLPEGVEMGAVIGTIKLYKNGRVDYNGQDISASASEFCGATLPVEPPVTELPHKSFEPAAAKDPVAGSVTQSATVEEPEPKAAFDIPRPTVNMAQ